MKTPRGARSAEIALQPDYDDVAGLFCQHGEVGLLKHPSKPLWIHRRSYTLPASIASPEAYLEVARVHHDRLAAFGVRLPARWYFLDSAPHDSAALAIITVAAEQIEGKQLGRATREQLNGNELNSLGRLATGLNEYHYFLEKDRVPHMLWDITRIDQHLYGTSSKDPEPCLYLVDLETFVRPTQSSLETERNHLCQWVKRLIPEVYDRLT